MGVVVAVVNQKGGVGKTTTTVNLGACLADAGRSVLVVDMDPQGNATTGLGIPKDSVEASTYDCLRDGLALSEVVRTTEIERLAIAPATVDLAGAEVELVSEIARETRLRACLEGVRREYDYVLLDSPPSLGLLTVNCLTAAEAVLIPIQCEYYALEGLTQLRRTLELVRRMLNPGLEVLGVVLTMYDGRTRLSAEVADEVRRYFPGRVFKTVIPRTVKLSEAPIYGKPIVRYAPETRGARAYTELAKEVIESGEAQRAEVADTYGDDRGAGGAGGGEPGRAGDGGAGGPDQAVAEPAPAGDAGGGDSGADGVHPGARDPAAGGAAPGRAGGVRAGGWGEEISGGAAAGAEGGAGGGEGGGRPGGAGDGAGGEPAAGGYQPDGGGGGVPEADPPVRAEAGAGGGAGGEEPGGGGEHAEAAEPA